MNQRQCFPPNVLVGLFIDLYTVKTFETVGSEILTIQMKETVKMKATEWQYFAVVLFIMLCKVVLTYVGKSVDESP